MHGAYEPDAVDEVSLTRWAGKPVDWWALGVIMYEMLTSIPPFNDKTPEMVFENIVSKNILWPEVPEEMSYEAYDIINKLLEMDPDKRLGANGTTSPFRDASRPYCVHRCGGREEAPVLRGY